MDGEPASALESEHYGFALSGQVPQAGHIRDCVDIVAENCTRPGQLDSTVRRGACDYPETVGFPVVPQRTVRISGLEAMRHIVENECRVRGETGEVRLWSVIAEVVNDAIDCGQGMHLVVVQQVPLPPALACAADAALDAPTLVDALPYMQ